MSNYLLLAIITLAACGMVSCASFGVTSNSVGGGPSYLKQLWPSNGPKQGGTPITIQGAGFVPDARAQCRFTRINPSTNVVVNKFSSATYVSPTQIKCDSPDWDEDDSPSIATSPLTGKFMGHTGSPYLRSDNNLLNQQIGVGDYIKLSVAQVGVGASLKKLTQYYQVAAIRPCTATEGCWCSGTSGTWEEDRYTVDEAQISYNGTTPGYPNSAANTGFEVALPVRKDSAGRITWISSSAAGTLDAICNGVNDCKCALHRYDMLRGGAGDPNAPLTTQVVNSGTTCRAQCTGGTGWAAGSQITLAEPVWKINGKPNVAFVTATNAEGFNAKGFSCTSCKCQDGCKVTVSYTNDGSVWSGNGDGGNVWSGSALGFSVKDIVPIVQYLDLGLTGKRDSTRIFGPPSGGTVLTVIGRDFQNSPLLRCWFDGVKTMVKAQYIDSGKLTCKTPPFVSRLITNAAMSSSNQIGSSMVPEQKVMVTNDGTLGIPETEGDFYGHLSQNPYLTRDGSPAYIQTDDQGSMWDLDGAYQNPFRSTCLSGLYPNEGMAPCRKAHRVAGVTNVQLAAASSGNDVLFKYATCHEGQPAGEAPSLNYYPSPPADTGSRPITNVQSLGQEIYLADVNYRGPDNGAVVNNNKEKTTGSNTLNANNVEGPLSYIQLHLEKASKEVATIEVTISSSNYKYLGGQVAATEIISISRLDAGTDNMFSVFFSAPAYLLPGVKYYLQLKYVSGAQDVIWKTAASSGSTAASAVASGGATSAAIGSTIVCAAATCSAGTQLAGTTFKLKGFTCEGCRTKYSYDPGNTDKKDDLKIGLTSSDPAPGSSGQSQRDDNSFRSMLAQEVRPSSTGTLTHVHLELKTVSRIFTTGTGASQTSDDMSYVAVWVTKYGKFQEYVCNAFGGYQPSSTCDNDGDGVYSDLCKLGSICNPNNALNGGCGSLGECSRAVAAGNVIRPEQGSPSSPCGLDINCVDTMSIQPNSFKRLTNVDGFVEFEFLTPVPVTGFTTYFINVAIVSSTAVSKDVIWYSGVARGDGYEGQVIQSAIPNQSVQTPAIELRASYIRSSYVWAKNANRVMSIKMRRCLSSTAQVTSFSTGGAATSCCSARVSPQGGTLGASITLTGINFFPSEKLQCIFRGEDGTGGMSVPAQVLDYSFQTIRCNAPSFDPHMAAGSNCANPKQCQGTVVVVSNDGYTVGPQFFGPKWRQTKALGTLLSASAQPASLGPNTIKILFSEIFCSPSGSDVLGDGTLARPFNTIQRAVDAANPVDQIVLLSGTYTGPGNKAIYHNGKKLYLRSGKNPVGGDNMLQDTVVDCQNGPEGFVFNDNMDASVVSMNGFIDTADIVIRNCNQIRIYKK